MTILSITIESCGVINNFVNDAIRVRELHKCRVNFKFNGVEVILGKGQIDVQEACDEIVRAVHRGINKVCIGE